MAKLAQATSKYCIHAKFEAEGIVERPDVIGAVFGQTEGLLGADMDLRELQKTGRIGRVDVELRSNDGKTTGTIDVPSSLDVSETALIGATLETIERIGPCDTKITISKIEDVRANKRQYLMERAKELLSSTFDESEMEGQEISEQLMESVRGEEIIEFEGLPAGPSVANSDSIIICEGRADVVKLLKNGIKNAIAIEGTSVPDAIVALSKKKEATAFLDGDRGGDLILKEMKSRGVDLDFVARAPEGKEVEELTKKEIYKAVREKARLSEARDVKPSREAIRTSKPLSQRPVKSRIPDDQKKKLVETYEKVKGSKTAYILDENMEVLGKISTGSIHSAVREVDDVNIVVMDGVIEKRLLGVTNRVGVKIIVGTELEKYARRPHGMEILTEDQFN